MIRPRPRKTTPASLDRSAAAPSHLTHRFEYSVNSVLGIKPDLFMQGEFVLSKNFRRNNRLGPILDLAARMGQKKRARFHSTVRGGECKDRLRCEHAHV